MRTALRFLLPLLFATTAGAQPAVVVLPQALDSGATAILEVDGESGVRRFEVPLLEQVVELPVTGSAPWHLRCADPGLWCQDLLLTGEAGDPRPFPIFRRAQVTGKLPARVAGQRPERVVIQGWIAYSKLDPPMLFVLELPVERGEFAGALPYGTVDLRIAVAGAAPIYRWDVQPDEQGFLDLGEITPVAGGSLSGFLVAPSDAGTADISVDLEPLYAAATPRLMRQLGRMKHSTKADASGFFQFSGVEPGRYRLVAKGNGVAGGVDVVEIEADEEAHLRRIDLHGTLALRVRVLPSAPPGGGRWTVVISGGAGDPREESASEAGEAIVSQLHHGEYRVSVVSPDGARALDEAVVLTEDRTVELHANLVVITGVVRLGGEPLIARVVVETGEGDATALESTSAGTLVGWVPRPDRRFLRLHVSAPHIGLERTMELVGAEVDLADDRLRLDLDLSQARVHGRVVDEFGRAVPDARVQASRGWLPAAEASTDVDGRFSLDGLETGAFWVTARQGRLGAADPVRVELTESRDETELVLVSKPTRPISGSLSAADGSPIAGRRSRSPR